ncbi:MAG: hypothetical protein ABI740_07600 [Alphaproteobacteria bacterium]
MGKRLGALALLAMAVRAIVPAGYMLATADTAGGRYLTITLCDAHGDNQRVLDVKAGKYVDPSEVPANHSNKVEHAPCVFAIAAPAAPPAASIELIAFSAVHQDIVLAVPRDIRPGRGIAAPPPPSTGPPLQS